MRAVGRLLHGLRALLSPGRGDHDLDDELRAFLETSIDAKVAAGMPRTDAERASRTELGSAAAVKDWTRDVGWESRVESVWQDVRYATRVLRRTPSFAVFAVVTLALGIGASTAIFSVAYGVALRPLPYPQPERLVRLYEARPADGELEHEVSVAAFHAWREGARSIQSAALFSKISARFLANTDSSPLAIGRVSPTFFHVLGVSPLVGRGFRPEATYTRFNATYEAVLSFAAWHRLFGGRADIIGQSLEFVGVGDNDVIRIVGVMPEGFAFAEAVDLWIPSLIVEDPTHRLMRQWRYDRVIARLQPGASIEQARSELTAISARLAETYPSTNAGWTVTVKPLHEAVIGNFGTRTWLLLGAVAVVLLVACVNVGGLVLARTITRERETAVRVALGAGTWRLLRLWLAEAGLLSAAGAALGIVLAQTGLQLLIAAAPPGIPRVEAIALDRPVLVAAFAATLLAFIGCAVAPLGAVRRRDLMTGLRSGSAGADERPASQTVRFALIAMQCAGAAALVILATMLARSFEKLSASDLGWEAAGVLTLRPSPPMPRELRRPWARYVEWSDRLVKSLEARPEIARAAITTQIPLSADTYPASVARGRGKQEGRQESWPAVQHHISDGYFDAMRIRLIQGRTFGAADRFTAAELIAFDTRPPSGVAIVTESTARALWPGQSALGQALWLPSIDNIPWREVVGVVEDIDFHGVGEAGVHHVFVPWTQYPTGNPRLIVKDTSTDAGAAALAPIVRAVLQEVEPGTRVDQVVALEELMLRATAQPRFTSRLVALFGIVALVLAAVGIHGTLAYVVRSRTREIGIRVALGAPRSAILRATLVASLVPVLLGAVVGTAAAIAVARSSAALLFEVSPVDVTSIAAGAAVLTIAALAAAAGPARRAARVDPLVALRAE